jgi:hypothetical protein
MGITSGSGFDIGVEFSPRRLFATRLNRGVGPLALQCLIGMLPVRCADIALAKNHFPVFRINHRISGRMLGTGIAVLAPAVTRGGDSPGCVKVGFDGSADGDGVAQGISFLNTRSRLDQEIAVHIGLPAALLAA